MTDPTPLSPAAAELDHCQQLLLDDRRQRHPLADRARAALANREHIFPTPSQAAECGGPCYEGTYCPEACDCGLYKPPAPPAEGEPSDNSDYRVLLIKLTSHMAYMQEKLEEHHQLDDLEGYYWYRESVALQQRVAGVLAEPEAKGPRGRPAAAPVPDFGELAAALKVIDKMQQEWVLLGNDDNGTASPSLSMPISLRRFTVPRDVLFRAATLLQQQAAPVPVSERLPGPGDCDAEGRCWWWRTDDADEWWELLCISDAREYNAGCGNARYTHWLPANALPLPAPEVQP